ncbi:MAG TPA: SRPBCC family protein [Candidatus Thermoplasmatota archaeon]|nr:SRPBCC family protein [Candidatus Thermoplasmatota archaeon]
MAKPYVVEASAVTKAPLDVAARAITDPANLPKWFKGACDVEADGGYPAVGGTMQFKVKWGGMKSNFAATVKENALPGKLVQRVKTPSGTSDITHTFTAWNGGTRYTKRVEVEDASWLLRLLMGSFLPRSVRNEVAAAARVADDAIAR